MSSETNNAVEPAFRSGFVALIGRPNAGKSTLLNACMGEKIAITSPVAQTTRKRMRAVINTPNSQLVIIDTPGLHKPKDALGSELNKSALGELADADVVAFLIDATKEVGTGDEWVANHVAATDADYKLLVLTKADISKPEQVSAQLEAAQKLCDFDDVIVTSAKEGFNVDGFVELVSAHLPEGPRWFPEGMDTDTTDEDWRRMMAVDMDGAFYACRAVLPGMIHQKYGRILLVSSMWGQTGGSCEVAYSAAKAGLIGLGKALAKEEGPSGITVNVIAPGVIDTDMMASFTDEDREETPVERLGTADEIARTMVFLADEASGYITGQVLGVNGGLVI